MICGLKNWQCAVVEACMYWNLARHAPNPHNTNFEACNDFGAYIHCVAGKNFEAYNGFLGEITGEELSPSKERSPKSVPLLYSNAKQGRGTYCPLCSHNFFFLYNPLGCHIPTRISRTSLIDSQFALFKMSSFPVPPAISAIDLSPEYMIQLRSFLQPDDLLEAIGYILQELSSTVIERKKRCQKCGRSMWNEIQIIYMVTNYSYSERDI